MSALTVSIAQSQSRGTERAVATITATATIVGNLDLIVLKDLEFEISSLSPTELVLDPQKNPYCGKIEIVGSPNSLVRLTYETQSVLRHEGGQSVLYFANNLSGNASEVQRESVLITHENQIRLNDRGVYYLWVGGRLAGVEGIMPGQYTMEFTIQLDYVQ
jgi:hypothetical protein